MTTPPPPSAHGATFFDPHAAGMLGLTKPNPPPGSVDEQLTQLLRYAVMAPSSHNSQPWLFRVQGESVFIFADRERRLPAVDPFDRELTISVGAATCALRIAMRAHGIGERCAIMPSPKHRDLLAVVRATGRHEPTHDDVVLCHAIPARRTNRGAYRADTLTDKTIGIIARAVQAEDAMIAPIDDKKTKHKIAELIAEGDKRQFKDAKFKRELGHWMRSNHTEARDGVPVYAIDAHHVGGMWDALSHLSPLVVRRFVSPKKQAARDEELADHSPVLAVLFTRADGPWEWMRAGQGLMRGLLAATACGVSHSYLNQPIEVPELREKLAGLLSLEGVPQMVLRMGHGEDCAATPRRDVKDVTLTYDPLSKTAKALHDASVEAMKRAH
jgi:hypothetical protein